MRGGTTLLSDLLNSHSKIAIFERELRALMWSGLSGGLHTLLVLRHLYSSLARVRDTRFRHQVHRYIREMLRQEHILSRAVGSESIHRAFCACLANTSTRYVGDKYPNYIWNYPSFIRKPDDRTIFVIRDPRDAVSSIIHRTRSGDWAGKKWASEYSSIEGATAYWADVATAIADVRTLGGNSLIIRYEDLVLETNRTMQTIANYLEVPVEGFDQSPVHANSIGKHKRVLKTREIRQIEQAAGALMAVFGYEQDALCTF